MRVLVSVKTYPTLSNKYDEVVCTAGFRENGEWIRLYPVPFRKHDEYQRYKKFQWIELDVERNTSDKRNESYRPCSEIVLQDSMGLQNDWRERREFVIEKNKVYTNLEESIAKNKKGELSLCTFKPTEIVNVHVEVDASTWDKELLDAIELRSKQQSLFGETPVNFQVVRKLPFKFKYEIKDDSGKTSKMMIEDWELGQLFWRQFDKYKNQQRAIDDVVSKYMKDLIVGRDTHLFLGTTSRWDAIAPNPFVIIGVFYPPIVKQNELF